MTDLDVRMTGALLGILIGLSFSLMLGPHYDPHTGRWSGGKEPDWRRGWFRMAAIAIAAGALGVACAEIFLAREVAPGQYQAMTDVKGLDPAVDRAIESAMSDGRLTRRETNAIYLMADAARLAQAKNRLRGPTSLGD